MFNPSVENGTFSSLISVGIADEQRGEIQRHGDTGKDVDESGDDDIVEDKTK